MNFTASPTVTIDSAASSGISIPNSSSNANRVETVSAQILDEARTVGHLFPVHVQVFNHDLLHALSDIAHFFLASSSLLIVLPRVSRAGGKPNRGQKPWLKGRAWYHKLLRLANNGNVLFRPTL
jgi:hypothetical protein